MTSEGGLVVVWSVLLHLFIWGEECCVEDVMDLPLLRNAHVTGQVVVCLVSMTS